MLVQKPYGLLCIQDFLCPCKGYKYFTKIDLSMQFYSCELDKESIWLCAIVTPFGGKYHNLHIPMGIHNSPYFMQQIMEDVLCNFLDDGIEVYLDDIGVFSNEYDEHVAVLSKVLQLLQDNGFHINPLKCEWVVQETDWLGYLLTLEVIYPWKKKIKTILQLNSPKNQTQVHSFMGAINHYCDMWPHHAHILAPLTLLTGKGPFVWMSQHQEAFEAMKQLICMDTMLAYPNQNKQFHIYMDALDHQLGSVLLQDGHPIAYYLCQLSSHQCNYTTIEKELLSIVAT
jgi:hypothetical protein